MAGEVLVNSYSMDFQKNPDIATFVDGSYIVVWNSYYSGVGTTIAPVTYVAAQRFNANGTPIGSETVVFAAPETASKGASVTVLSDGAYVVMWTFDDYDAITTNSSRVYAKVYNANGTVRREAFRVDQTPDEAAGNPEAYATAGGGFVITYSVYEAPYNDVYQRAYDARGNALGGQTQVNTVVDDNNQFAARSETLSNGRILTAWTSVSTFDAGPGSLRNEVRATLMAADGRVLRADFHLTLDEGTTRQEAGGFDIGALHGGGFAVIHPDSGRSFGQPFVNALFLDRFTVAGTETGAQIRVHTTDEIIYDSEVTQLASGEIVVVWLQSSESTQNIGSDVMARVFSADGRALTGAFTVSVDRNSTDDQESIRAESLAGGGFIVTYTSESIDGDEEGIAARTFGRGTSGRDVLTVDQSGTMAGLGGNDTLRGDARANALAGGAGLDTLTGGGGADHFVFDRPNGVDRVTDFAAQDLIVLQARGFGGLALGQLDASVFRLGAGADANDRILYIEATGALYFDANGSEAGGRVQFATLTPGTDLMAADFLVI